MGRLACAACLVLSVCGPLSAQPEGWTRPFPGHRVIGNLYAVGTYDLGVFLVTSDQGHMLINTGLRDSTGLIRSNIKSLGFRLEDVKILLTMQAHWDHTAALAEIKQITGAQMRATEGDARVLEDGGFSDPHFGGRVSFQPVAVDKIISDGEVIELGTTRLTVVETPGHTQGSASYTMRARENGRDYSVVIANMGTINPGKRLVVDPTYPGVAADFAETFRKQKALDIDIWVAAPRLAVTACTGSTRRASRTIPQPLWTPMDSGLPWNASKGCTCSSWRKSGVEDLPGTCAGHGRQGPALLASRYAVARLPGERCKHIVDCELQAGLQRLGGDASRMGGQDHVRQGS